MTPRAAAGASVTAPEHDGRVSGRLTQREMFERLTERARPASAEPFFSVSQTKATGGATVFEWEVHVPVCDEFPTADQAFEATMRYARMMRTEFAAGEAPPAPKTDAEQARGQAQYAAIAARQKAGGER